MKRVLTFGAAPKRIVSLVPSDTFSVAVLGCADALVGRTDYCELPAEVVAKLPSVGGTKNPKIDAICDPAGFCKLIPSDADQATPMGAA